MGGLFSWKSFGVELDEAVVLQHRDAIALRGERGLVAREDLLGNVRRRHAADARGRTNEGRVHDLLADTDDFEDLSTVVRREERDANLGEDLEDTGLKRLARVAH